jgi:hypothetical protein
MTSSEQVEFQQPEYYLKAILEKVCYIESRLDEAQGKSSDIFRHIQQGLIEFDQDLGGAAQFEKNFNSLFESFSKNPILQGLSSIEKLSEFKIMVKAAQMDSFEQVPQAALEIAFFLLSLLFLFSSLFLNVVYFMHFNVLLFFSCYFCYFFLLRVMFWLINYLFH